MQKKDRSRQITNITVASMMIALSVVIGIFCKNYLNFGMGLFRITFENLPIILAGLTLGPVVGGIVGLASDLVSYIFSMQVYPPNIIVTLGAALVGIISGIISRYVIKKRGTAQIIASAATAHIVASMIVKSIGLYQFYGILVLWRIPMYLVIATLEITTICLFLKRKSFARLVGYVGDENDELR